MKNKILGCSIAFILLFLSAPAQEIQRIAIIRLESELYSGIEKGFRTTVEGLFQEKVIIDTYKVKDLQGEIEPLAKKVILEKPGLIVTIGSSPAKFGYPLFKEAKIPYVYIGVTEPKLIGLDYEGKSPDELYTGVRWGVSLRTTMKFFRMAAPWAKKIGLIYAEKLPQDKAYVECLKMIEKEFDFEIIYIPIKSKAQLLSLSEKDCDIIVPWYGFLMMGKSMAEVKTAITDKLSVPVFYGDALAGEKIGGIASIGANLFYEGKQAGVMASKILKGVDIHTIPPEEPKRVFIVINVIIARKYGIRIPMKVLETANKIIAK